MQYLGPGVGGDALRYDDVVDIVRGVETRVSAFCAGTGAWPVRKYLVICNYKLIN